MRVVTFGRQPTSPPPGTFREIWFPQLARLDQGTNEGWINRILSSDGANSRALPRTISFQELDTFGHDMAAASGALHEVTVDGEAGLLSGKGWLADNEWGHKNAIAVLSQSLFHNSIDLAEVTKTSIVEHGDWWDDDYTVDLTFEEWSLGKTTQVAMPAFADAHSILADELAAALHDMTPLINNAPSYFGTNSALEIVASLDGKRNPRPNFDYFHRPEPDHLTAVTVEDVDADGWMPVMFHLADWTRKHRNASGQWVHPPRARDNYAHYCASKVLSDKGFVKVGPVTLLGGHVSIQHAVEQIENTWADVRVIDGKFGPWACGVVRPHVAQDLAREYAARASQVSGYWPDGETLRLICSVNAGGFPVLEPSTNGEYALVASLAVEGPGPMPTALKSFRELGDADKRTIKQWVRDALTIPGPQPGSPAEQLFVGGDVHVHTGSFSFSSPDFPNTGEPDSTNSDPVDPVADSVRVHGQLSIMARILAGEFADGQVDVVGDPAAVEAAAKFAVAYPTLSGFAANCIPAGIEFAIVGDALEVTYRFDAEAAHLARLRQLELESEPA